MGPRLLPPLSSTPKAKAVTEPPLEDRGAQWMLQFQQGDERAFDNIVDEYQGVVFNMFRRLLGPHALIEDMAQEAFVRLYRSRDRYQPSGKLATFLYRITYNLALNRVRDDKRKPTSTLPRAEDGTPLALLDPKTGAPEDSSHHQDWADLIGVALTELPENQRAALVLQHYDGLDLVEIGEVLQISPKAAKSLLHRAREKMRSLLQPFKDAEQD